MAQNFNHISSIISAAFTSSKCNDNCAFNFDTGGGQLIGDIKI